MGNCSCKPLCDSLEKIRKSSEYSDLVIKCGRDVHKVHRAIICPRSEVLAEAERSSSKDKGMSVITLFEDDPAMVKRMIDYLYLTIYAGADGQLPKSQGEIQSLREREAMKWGLAEFPDPEFHIFLGIVHKGHYLHDCRNGPKMPSETGYWKEMNEKSEKTAKEDKEMTTTSADLAVHAHMYALGEKYKISDLKDMAKDKFDHTAKRHWNSTKFLSVVDMVYSEETYAKLRDAVVEAMARHMRQLVRNPQVEVAMKKYPNLSFAIMKKSNA